MGTVDASDHAIIVDATIESKKIGSTGFQKVL
jgi:hypothetical protein